MRGGRATFVKCEDRWPYQWIAQCDRCHVGTRCNTRADAVAFLAKYCPHYARVSSEGGEN